MVPSMGTVSSDSRIASTATWSDLWRSPWPMVWAQAIAACSTTRRKSSDRSEFTCVLGLCRIGRKLTACGLVLPEPEHVIGLHDLVDLAGALVDDRALAVAIEAAGRVFVRVAVRAVHLHAVARRALRSDGGKPL